MEDHQDSQKNPFSESRIRLIYRGKYLSYYQKTFKINTNSSNQAEKDEKLGLWEFVGRTSSTDPNDKNIFVDEPINEKSNPTIYSPQFLAEINGCKIVPLFTEKEDQKEKPQSESKSQSLDSVPTDLLLVAEFRQPWNCTILSFPGGLVDPGESLTNSAVRELKEETGFSADKALKEEYPFSKVCIDPWKSQEVISGNFKV